MAISSVGLRECLSHQVTHLTAVLGPHLIMEGSLLGQCLGRQLQELTAALRLCPHMEEQLTREQTLMLHR